MAKHTKGPWEAGRKDMATFVDGIESKWIYAGRKYIAVASGRDVKDWKEIMANAHLIAAAPELLEVLKATRILHLESYKENTVGKNLSNIIEQAITKAEGK